MLPVVEKSVRVWVSLPGRNVRVAGAYVLLGADVTPGRRFVTWRVGAYVAVRLLRIEAKTVEEPTL